MTPDEVLLYAKQNYNAESDSFFSDSEGYKHLWAAQMILARETHCIERVYTTTTTSGTREYSVPTLALGIKRVTYNGQKLEPYSFRVDDLFTVLNESTTSTGTPKFYVLWNRTLYLRPIPDSSSATLRIYTFNKPDETASGGTLDVPEAYHLMLADYLLWRFSAKDQNFQAANYWQAQWEERMKEARRAVRKEKTGDAFTQVIDDESMPVNVVGAL